MTISTEIARLKTSIANAYDALEAKGAIIPAIENPDNLVYAIDTISVGGGDEITATNTTGSTIASDTKVWLEPTTVNDVTSYSIVLSKSVDNNSIPGITQESIANNTAGLVKTFLDGNGTYAPTLTSKTITSNGTYTISSSDNAYGFNSITATVPATGSTIEAVNVTGSTVNSGDKVWLNEDFIVSNKILSNTGTSYGASYRSASYIDALGNKSIMFYYHNYTLVSISANWNNSSLSSSNLQSGSYRTIYGRFVYLNNGDVAVPSPTSSSSGYIYHEGNLTSITDVKHYGSGSYGISLTNSKYIYKIDTDTYTKSENYAILDSSFDITAYNGWYDYASNVFYAVSGSSVYKYNNVIFDGATTNTSEVISKPGTFSSVSGTTSDCKYIVFSPSPSSSPNSNNGYASIIKMVDTEGTISFEDATSDMPASFLNYTSQSSSTAITTIMNPANNILTCHKLDYSTNPYSYKVNVYEYDPNTSTWEEMNIVISDLIPSSFAKIVWSAPTFNITKTAVSFRVGTASEASGMIMAQIANSGTWEIVNYSSTNANSITGYTKADVPAGNTGVVTIGNSVKVQPDKVIHQNGIYKADASYDAIGQVDVGVAQTGETYSAINYAGTVASGDKVWLNYKEPTVASSSTISGLSGYSDAGIGSYYRFGVTDSGLFCFYSSGSSSFAVKRINNDSTVISTCSNSRNIAPACCAHDLDTGNTIISGCNTSYGYNAVAVNIDNTTGIANADANAVLGCGITAPSGNSGTIVFPDNVTYSFSSSTRPVYFWRASNGTVYGLHTIYYNGSYQYPYSYQLVSLDMDNHTVTTVGTQTYNMKSGNTVFIGLTESRNYGLFNVSNSLYMLGTSPTTWGEYYLLNTFDTYLQHANYALYSYNEFSHTLTLQCSDGIARSFLFDESTKGFTYLSGYDLEINASSSYGSRVVNLSRDRSVQVKRTNYGSSTSTITATFYETPASWYITNFTGASSTSVTGYAAENISAGSSGNVIVGTAIEPILNTLNVTSNGTYTPETGDGFDEVNVNVSTAIDNSTITENASNQLQTVALVNANGSGSTPLKVWHGTEQQWINGVGTNWYNWRTDVTYTPDFTRINNIGTITDGIFTGTFTGTSSQDGVYKTLGDSFTYNNTVDVIIKFKMTNLTQNNQWRAICAIGTTRTDFLNVPVNAINLTTTNSRHDRFYWFYAGNNNNYILPASALLAGMVDGTWYWLKLTYDKSNSMCSTYQSEDGINYTPISSVVYSLDNINFNLNTVIGLSEFNSTTSYTGSIDLYESCIKTDGSVFWAPYIAGTYSECFTLSTTPETTDTVYSAPNTASALTITSTSTGTITLSDNNTYTYTQSGDQTTYQSIGEAHPTLLCNINGVGVKVGNTLIADATDTSAFQTTANLVTSVDENSTDTEYPSAKLFYDTCVTLQNELHTINSGS